MKMFLSAALLATLALGGCAPQTDAAKQGTPVADAQAPKKKCDADASTGSRMHICNGMSADAVSGESGDAYRNAARSGTSAGKSN